MRSLYDLAHKTLLNSVLSNGLRSPSAHPELASSELSSHALSKAWKIVRRWLFVRPYESPFPTQTTPLSLLQSRPQSVIDTALLLEICRPHTVLGRVASPSSDGFEVVEDVDGDGVVSVCDDGDGVACGCVVVGALVGPEGGNTLAFVAEDGEGGAGGREEVLDGDTTGYAVLVELEADPVYGIVVDASLPLRPMPFQNFPTSLLSNETILE